MRKVGPALSLKLSGVNVLLTLLIVWLHVSANYDVPSIVSNIAVISVPCFFAMSSFWYFLSFDFDRPWNSYKSKVKTRIHSLMIPFIIFSMLGLLFNLAAHIVHPVSAHPLSGISSLSDIVRFIYSSQSNGPLWYLRSLFAFILIAPLLGFFIKASKWSILLTIPLYIGCRNLSYFFFPYWLVDIFIGAYIAIYFDEIKQILDKLNHPLIKWGGLIICTLAAILINDVYTLRAFAPICLTITVCAISTSSMKSLTAIAPYCMLIYCLHLPVSRITSKIPGLINISNPMIALIIGTLTTVLMIIAIGIILKKNPVVWKIMTGGR